MKDVVVNLRPSKEEKPLSNFSLLFTQLNYVVFHVQKCNNLEDAINFPFYPVKYSQRQT